MSILITTEGDSFVVRSPYDENLIPVLRGIYTAKWTKEIKAWVYKASPGMAYTLSKRLRPFGFSPDDKFMEMAIAYTSGRLDDLNAAATGYMTCTPNFDHQNIGLALTTAREYIYLTWEMGTGKSKVIVDTAGVMKMKRILIVCPKSVVQEWPRQFRRHGRCYNIRCIALEKGTVKKRMQVAHKALCMFPAALVINYDAVWRAPFKRWALNREWDMVVADECHRIKGGKSRASEFFAELREFSAKRVALSGTPIPNNPIDLWAQCRFLDPHLFGDSFTGFRSRYGVVQEFTKKARDEKGNYIYDAQGNKIDGVKKNGAPDSFRTIVAFRNLQALNEIFGRISHRVEKDTCLDLPEVMDEVREIELGKDGVKHYDAMIGAFKAKVHNRDITIANALVELLRLQQCTGGAVQYDDSEGIEQIDTSKRVALEDILQGLERQEAVVVFCRFRHDLDAVHEAAANTDRTSTELSGRKKELDKWRDTRAEDGQPSVIAVQIQSGGLGVDLTRARYCIYYSLGHSLGEYEQSRSRVHRQGQTRKVVYYHILGRSGGKATIDHGVYKALKKKADVVRAIIAEHQTSA